MGWGFGVKIGPKRGMVEGMALPSNVVFPLMGEEFQPLNLLPWLCPWLIVKSLRVFTETL
jgi:hypothetical protein